MRAVELLPAPATERHRADRRVRRRRAQGRVQASLDGQPTDLDGQRAGLHPRPVADERPARAVDERLRPDAADPDRPAGAARRVGDRRLGRRQPGSATAPVTIDLPRVGRRVVPKAGPDPGLGQPRRVSLGLSCRLRRPARSRPSASRPARPSSPTPRTSSEAAATPVFEPTAAVVVGAVGGVRVRHDHRDAAAGATAGVPFVVVTEIATTWTGRSR